MYKFINLKNFGRVEDINWIWMSFNLFSLCLIENKELKALH